MGKINIIAMKLQLKLKIRTLIYEKYMHISNKGEKMEEITNLVNKAKRNDYEAFCKLIEIIKNDLYLIAKTRLKNEEDIADVIQETIITCYNNIRFLRKETSFKSWTIKVLINKCNKIYKNPNNINISIESNSINEYIGTTENNDEKLNFEDLIKDLSADEKLILTLYYYSRYTTKEISKITKIKENTIKSKISRAKEKIYKKYGGINV